MWAYIARRALWTIPIVVGIILITFILFTFVAPDPARLRVGKQATPEKLKAERKKMGLDKPVWINLEAAKATTRPAADPDARIGLSGLFDSQFFDVLLWNMVDSDHYHKPLMTIAKDEDGKRHLTGLIPEKAPISAAIQIPIFIIELGIQLCLALLCASRRGRWPDVTITFLAVLGMCIPTISIIIALQWLLGFKLDWFPIAGWSTGFGVIQFAVLPIVVGVISGIGGGTRFYRTVMVEEIYNDYVRTARAKGVAESRVLLVHVLRNTMIPAITNTITTLPYLLLGSFLLERMFQIPGLGYVMVEGIQNEDRPVVLGLTYLISIVYCLLLLVTDIMYTLVDPRVKLK